MMQMRNGVGSLGWNDLFDCHEGGESWHDVGMEAHEWREKTEEGTRYFRATYHAGGWKFQKTLKTDPDWEQIPHPDADLWLTLRDILWRRYQRKRGSWTIIEKIDKMLEKDFGIMPDGGNE
jgi:hypothetical protein